MSLLIPATDFAFAESLSPFLDLLDLEELPEDGDAKRIMIESAPAKPLPPASEFDGSELLEALFLEDPQPVVIFDAPSPELVTIRLLTALWPGSRQQFAVSTFALSPRKVGGRDFNLVFAPKDARSKFSDWNGRRIDGRSAQASRHRWTGTIVSRVFDDPRPRLLSSVEEGLVKAEGNAGENAAALRITLLWDELLAKLDTTPTAALGLLDIANSGKVRSNFARKTLEPFVADAVRRAPLRLPDDEAWDFLGAIARKLHGRGMQRGAEAVESAVAVLAEQAPEGALALLSKPDDRGTVEKLLPIIANGIGNGFTDRAERALLSAPPAQLGSLVAMSPVLAAKVACNQPLIDRFSEITSKLDPALAISVGEALLPHLVLDWQLPAAQPFLKMLDAESLASEVRHLGSVNDFGAPKMAELCIRYAREIGAKTVILVALAGLPRSERRDVLLAGALDPSVDDAAWLLGRSGLPSEIAKGLFAGLLRRATDRELGAIFGDRALSPIGIEVAQTVAPDILIRMVFIDVIPLEAFVRIVDGVLDGATAEERISIASKALERCLGHEFGGDELAFIVKMLGIVGERLNSGWAARLGLRHGIRSSVASRNMIAFHKAPQTVRLRFVVSIAEVAQLLQGRRSFDLDASAADACANFLFEAEKAAPVAALAASGHLLPMLMQQKRDPVSLMVAAAFPIVYRELAKKDEVPDLLKFMPFFDWDRCKAARQELVSAFMSSSWMPGHLALAACRCSDIPRIMRRTAKSYGGEDYLNRVASDLARVPEGCRKNVEKMISSIRSDWSSKYSWRD